MCGCPPITRHTRTTAEVDVCFLRIVMSCSSTHNNCCSQRICWWFYRPAWRRRWLDAAGIAFGTYHRWQSPSRQVSSSVQRQRWLMPNNYKCAVASSLGCRFTTCPYRTHRSNWNACFNKLSRPWVHSALLPAIAHSFWGKTFTRLFAVVPWW